MTHIDWVDWHCYGPLYPQDLPREAAATHIGLFFAWAASRGLASERHARDHADGFARLLKRERSPASYVLTELGGKLESEDFGEAIQPFLRDYYTAHDQRPVYYNDTENLAEALGLNFTYRIPDDWEAFDRLALVIDQRFAERAS